MRAVFGAALIGLWPALVAAAAPADKPLYAPPAAWVKPLPIPLTGAGAVEAGAAQVLLEDSQIHFSEDGDQFYDEYAVKILTPEGLTSLGTIERIWNPETETLTINRLRILRGDKVIDLLAGGKTFTVLRRETKLEMAMLDGSLTAAFQPEDLQVGDILDFAATETRHDPVWRGISEAGAEGFGSGPIQRYHVSASWDREHPMHAVAADGLGPPKLRQEAGRSVFEIDLTNFTPPKVPLGAPARFGHPLDINFTGFADWAQASALMAPLYAKAATLAPASPLKAEIARIAADSRDPKTRAAEALHLVQEQVRYFFLGMDLGGYVPADADVTWQRRFGDCKGKTVLLLALLKGLGIDAQPALVSTTRGDGMDGLPPRLRLFDHVIVRVVIDGRVYWLDGARRGDRGLDDITPPPFRWALPLQTTGGKLAAIDQPPFPLPQMESQLTIDMTKGADEPAGLHVDLLSRGDSAIALHIATQTVAAADGERNLRALFTKSYPWVAVDTVASSWDVATGVERLSMDGKGVAPWSRFPGGRQLHLIGSQLGGAVSFTRQDGPHRDAPFAVAFPAYALNRTVVKLPGDGVGFALGGAGDVDQTAAGIMLHRSTRMAGGVVTMETWMKSVAREFPAADAPAAAATLQQLGLRDVWIAGSDQPAPSLLGQSALGRRPGYPTSTPGGAGGGAGRRTTLLYPPVLTPIPPVFAPAPPPPTPTVKAASMKPGTAMAYLTRANAWRAEGQSERALADLKTARALEPRNTPVLIALAQAQAGAGDFVSARASLAAALEIDPQNPQLWVRRGAVRLASGDAEGAKDIEHGVDSGPDGPRVMVAAARALMALGLWDPAVGYLDEAVAAYPTDAELGAALAARCLARAQGGKRLDRATHDCQMAVGLTGASSEALTGRAALELRQNLPEKAIADADAALAQRPDDPLALYLRGVARSRKGAPGAQDDLEQARKLDPGIAGHLVGMEPPGLTPRAGQAGSSTS